MLIDRKVLLWDTNVITFYTMFVDFYYNGLINETIFKIKNEYFKHEY